MSARDAASRLVPLRALPRVLKMSLKMHGGGGWRCPTSSLSAVLILRGRSTSYSNQETRWEGTGSQLDPLRALLTLLCSELSARSRPQRPPEGLAHCRKALANIFPNAAFLPTCVPTPPHAIALLPSVGSERSSALLGRAQMLLFFQRPHNK